MSNLGPPEIIVIVLVIVVLFGWKKLPDAARSLGRSMRIFKAEVEEMKTDKPSAASRETVRGETVTPADPAATTRTTVTTETTAPAQPSHGATAADPDAEPRA